MDSITVSTIDLRSSPEVIFGHFAAQPWSIFLDSAAPDHSENRYSVITSAPKATVITEQGLTQLRTTHDNQVVKESHDDPMPLLKHAIETILPQPTAETKKLPINLGALGYFAYDLGRCFEDLPNQSERDLNLPEMAVGIYDWLLVFDHRQLSYQLISTTAAQPRLTQRLLAFDRAVQPQQDNFSLTSDWQSNMTKASYQSRFEQVQEYLRSGDCYQINLTQRFCASYHGDEWQAYLHLRRSNYAPFSAFIRLPEAAVLSISPERFIRLQDGVIQTKPIKGTQPRSVNPQQDHENALHLQHSIKDRAENLMIVDLLRNDLSKVAVTGSVNVPNLFSIESFPAVHHLVSTVTANLRDDFHATDLLRDAFPGGSITGAPKIRAMTIIDELEPHRRSVYCGAIGYIDINGNMDTSITIRTLICLNQQVYCWAGGGIVIDSQCDAEYQETFDKVSKILPVLTAIDGNPYQ